MSSVWVSRSSEAADRAVPWYSRLRLWPRSMFGRLFAAVLAAVLVAQGVSMALVSRERDRVFVQAVVSEWSRRIADRTISLEQLDPRARAEVEALTLTHPLRLPPPGWHGRRELLPPPPERSQIIITPREVPDFRSSLEAQLRVLLGPGYDVAVTETLDPSRAALLLPRAGVPGFDSGGRLYDVSIRPPIGDPLLFRIQQGERGEPLPRNFLGNLLLLMLLTALALYLVTLAITRPLSRLAQAAEAVGRDLRQPPLPEEGARELRDAAHAFNVMQERTRRYLDSRTRVLAAMSHDLKTPLTRLRLRVETLADGQAREKFGRDLDEMETMVRGALSMLRGLNDDEPTQAVDIDALVRTIALEFAELGAALQVQGTARALYPGKPQALKRCLTNLVSNAVKFGCGGVWLSVEDGQGLTVRVRDDGPGVPAEQLGRVFEPFYRVESSRSRDTGGTGLGLSIALDIAQAHGGSLVLRNLKPRGLEAVLTLPRQ
ncbi:MAG TPA: ATP-binding protein [Steroidobacteraceae bacterium]|nr:ATP-binding protein [Steroidobacteraceae bacterium]